MFGIKIKPRSDNKKHLAALKEADFQALAHSVLRKGLISFVEDLQSASAGNSTLDYSRLEIVWTGQWYAIVLPETTRVIKPEERNQWVLLLEGGIGSIRRAETLGPLPIEAIPVGILASGRGVLRHVSPAELEGILTNLKKNPAALVAAGIATEEDIQDDKRLDRVLRWMPPARYGEVNAPEDLAWSALREEYGIGTKRVNIWRPALKRLQKFLHAEFKRSAEDMLLSEPKRRMNRLSIQNPEQIDFFSEHLEQKPKA